MSIGRLGAGPLRGISALLLLRAVSAPRLLAVLDALGVERAADDLVADAGEVLHPAAADEHDRVLLEVVADTGDVRRHLDAAGEPHTSHLAERRVRLLGRGRVDARADPPPLRRTLEGGRLVLRHLVLAALADQLLDCGHRVVLFPLGVKHWVVSGEGPRGRACRPVGAPRRAQRWPSIERCERSPRGSVWE